MARQSVEEMEVERELQMMREERARAQEKESQLEQRLERLRRSQSTQGSTNFPQLQYGDISARRQSAAATLACDRHRPSLSTSMSRSFTVQPTPSVMDRAISMSSEHSMPLMHTICENQFSDMTSEMLERLGQEDPANAYILQRAVLSGPDIGVNPGDFLSGFEVDEDVNGFPTDADLFDCPLSASTAPPSLVSGDSNTMSRVPSSTSTSYRSSPDFPLSDSTLSPALKRYSSHDVYGVNSQSQQRAAGKSQMNNDMLAHLGGFAAGPQSAEMSRTISNLSTSSMRSTQSNIERRAKESRMRQIENGLRNNIKPKPSDEVEKSDSSSGNASTKKDGKMPLTAKSKYVRPKHERVKCAKCNDHPGGFRGQHELQRHMSSKHSEVVKKWECRDPRDVGITTSLKPVTPLNKCKACQTRKQYGAYYNAAAHLRRAHFRTKNTRKNAKKSGNEDKNNKHNADLPLMPELKVWMHEVHVSMSDAISDPEESYDADMVEDEGDFDSLHSQMEMAHQAYTGLHDMSLPTPPDTSSNVSSSSPTYAPQLSPADMALVDIMDAPYPTRAVPTTPMNYHPFAEDFHMSMVVST